MLTVCLASQRGKQRTERDHENPTCAKFLQVNQVIAVRRNVVCRQLQNLVAKISQIHF